MTLNIHWQYPVLFLFFVFVFVFLVLVIPYVYFVTPVLFSFVCFLLRTEELEVSPLTNVILIEKVAQIMTSTRNKTIIITFDTKNKRKKRKEKKRK